MSLATGTIIFAIATFFSRITGLLRDISFASIFGTSSQYDAYLIAILIPFFLRKIFAEGAMQLAFIPMFNEKLNDRNYNGKIRLGRSSGRYTGLNRSASEFASTIITLMSVLTIITTLIGVSFSGSIAQAFSGSYDESAIELTSLLIKITFPFVLFISLWAIYCSILNSFSFFFIPALSPLIINLSTITGIFLSKFFTPAILGPSFGFILGGFLQLILLVFYARKKVSFKYRISFNFRMVKKFLPFFLISSITPAINQINSLIDVKVGTDLGVGVVSSLQYAMRLYQLPLGIFGVAVATVAFPNIAELINTKKIKEAARTIWEATSTMFFYIFPSTVALFLLGKDMIVLLFERGMFTPDDTMKVSTILMGFSLGLLFYSGYNVLSKSFFAEKKPMIPTLVSFLMVGTNIVLDIVLGYSMGPVGIALATSIAGGVGFVIVFFLTVRKYKIGSSFLIHTSKISVCTFMMGIFMFTFRRYVLGNSLGLLLNIVISVFIYLFFAHILKVKDVKMIIGKLKRRTNG